MSPRPTAANWPDPTPERELMMEAGVPEGVVNIVSGFGETAGAVLTYLSLTEHLQPLVGGLLVSTDIIYFLSVIAIALFLSQRSLESLRWR